jgi:hypothetical protein
MGARSQNNTTEGARACDLRPGPGLGCLKVLEWKEVFRVSSSIWWSMATSLFVWGIIVACEVGTILVFKLVFRQARASQASA